MTPVSVGLIPKDAFYFYEGSQTSNGSSKRGGLKTTRHPNTAIQADPTVPKSF